MCEHMFYHIFRSGESPGADVTVEEIFAAVQSTMPRQVVRPSELLPASVTGVRLLTGVRHNVPAQIVERVKLYRTPIATVAFGKPFELDPRLVV